ncbi:MAG: hypothetical protein KGM99_11605 [Burkholderiales bacterium]|nr:hypothetical protein [Burkholderiales bacterium]
MKNLKALILAMLLMPVSYSAFAAHPHFHGHGHGPRVSFGLYVNPFPVYYGRGYYRSYYDPYPYNYGPEVIVAPPVTIAPPVYIPAPTVIYETVPETAVPSNNDWLYCNNPDGFYPAIKSCPGGWQHVPAQPSGNR